MRLILSKLFKQKNEQHGSLRERTYADILNEQIYVETNGDNCWANKWFVLIEYPGTPCLFPENLLVSVVRCSLVMVKLWMWSVKRIAGNLHGKA